MQFLTSPLIVRVHFCESEANSSSVPLLFQTAEASAALSMLSAILTLPREINSSVSGLLSSLSTRVSVRLLSELRVPVPVNVSFLLSSSSVPSRVSSLPERVYVPSSVLTRELFSWS